MNDKSTNTPARTRPSPIANPKGHSIVEKYGPPKSEIMVPAEGGGEKKWWVTNLIANFFDHADFLRVGSRAAAPELKFTYDALEAMVGAIHWMLRGEFRDEKGKPGSGAKKAREMRTRVWARLPEAVRMFHAEAGERLARKYLLVQLEVLQAEELEEKQKFDAAVRKHSSGEPMPSTEALDVAKKKARHLGALVKFAQELEGQFKFDIVAIQSTFSFEGGHVRSLKAGSDEGSASGIEVKRESPTGAAKRLVGLIAWLDEWVAIGALQMAKKILVTDGQLLTDDDVEAAYKLGQEAFAATKDPVKELERRIAGIEKKHAAALLELEAAKKKAAEPRRRAS